MKRETTPIPSTGSVGISAWDLTQLDKPTTTPEENSTESTPTNSITTGIARNTSHTTTNSSNALTIPTTLHLPVELQFQILSEVQASTLPRLITVTSHSITGHRFRPSTTQFYKPQKPYCPFGNFARIERIYALATPPPLLSVSQEFRQELIDKTYQHSMSGDIFPNDEFDINENHHASWLRGDKVFVTEPTPTRVTWLDLKKDVLYFSDGGNYGMLSDPLAALPREIAESMERMACTARMWEILFFWPKMPDLWIFKRLRGVVILYGNEAGTPGWSECAESDWGAFYNREYFEEEMGKVFGRVEREFPGWKRPVVSFEKSKDDLVRSLNSFRESR